jgi:O-antigen ligase
LLTGRGFGAWHPVPYAREGVATFFHNEYLDVASNQGIIGLGCHVVLLFSVVMAGRKYCRDDRVGYLVAPGRLLFLAALPSSMFMPFVWHMAFGPMTMCFVAIARNSDVIVEGAYELDGYYDPQYQPALQVDMVPG